MLLNQFWVGHVVTSPGRQMCLFRGNKSLFKHGKSGILEVGVLLSERSISSLFVATC